MALKVSLYVICRISKVMQITALFLGYYAILKYNYMYP